MSRKNFQGLATALGLSLRWATEADAPGIRLAVMAVAVELGAQSSTFRRDAFLEWVEDVAAGRRDATGAKVKPAKVSA